MSTIVLMNYENYYNRRCLPPKQFIINPAIPGENDYEKNIITTFSNINFNPNDGVNTELVINWDGEMPNYLIVSDGYSLFLPTDTRWYVLNSKRTRSGQLVLTLRRDLVADFYDSFINAPAMIERGRLGINDPYIINDEGIVFNQIKQSETLLKDETEVAWVVGYIAIPEDGSAENISFNIEQSYDFSGDTITSWGADGLDYGYYVRANGQSNPVASSYGTAYTHKIWANPSNTTSITTLFQYGEETDYSLTYTGTTRNSTGLTVSAPIALTFEAGLERQFGENLTSLDSAAKTLSPSYSNTLADELIALEGKIVKVGTDKYYTIRVKKEPFWSDIAASAGSGYFSIMSYLAANAGFLGTPNYNSFGFRVQNYQYYLELEEIVNKASVTLTATRRILNDAPYSIFAMPYGLIDVQNENIITADLGGKELAVKMASTFRNLLGTKVYDVQLLPYCPVRRAIDGTNKINITNLVAGVDYSMILQSTGTASFNIGILLWAETSEFTLDINYLQILPNDRKTTNQCYTSRICSPNYSSIYEFNLAKNNGLNGFNIDCAYKPYNPYIHVYPKPANGSLYGKDFNDPRGLICSGDFSMTATSDQWAQYEINNKNYQNMFNRQIETMDLTHKMQRIEQGINIGTGALTGGMSAAGGTLMATGNPIAAGVVGGVGAVTSVGAGVADYAMSEKLRANERSQAYDMFRMSNENIQAMPDTLTKVSAFNPNNKIFPVYEVYSATDKEITAFQNYIKYYGMTVGRIGSVAEYLWPSEEFIQGRFIRFDNLAENTNIAAELNSEFMKGVYMKQ